MSLRKLSRVPNHSANLNTTIRQAAEQDSRCRPSRCSLECPGVLLLNHTRFPGFTFDIPSRSASTAPLVSRKGDKQEQFLVVTVMITIIRRVASGSSIFRLTAALKPFYFYYCVILLFHLSVITTIVAVAADDVVAMLPLLLLMVVICRTSTDGNSLLGPLQCQPLPGCIDRYFHCYCHLSRTQSLRCPV